jgi:hypothetical protein
MNGYEPSPDLTCRQLLNFKELSKIVLGVFIEYFIHPTNKVYHGLTPQPRSFLRDLPYSRGVVSYTLHQSVLIIDKLTNS